MSVRRKHPCTIPGCGQPTRRTVLQHDGSRVFVCGRPHEAQPIVSGRAYTSLDDADASLHAIVDEALARLPERIAALESVSLPPDDDPRELAVVTADGFPAVLY